MKIRDMQVIPVAFPDPPLRNSTGVHGSGQANTNSTGGANVSGNGSSPPGNNGTVKVDNYLDTNTNDQAPNNEPHVSCAWGIDAYGYEASAPTGTESFLQHPPTSGGSAQQQTLTNSHPRGTGRTYNGSTDNSLTLVGSPHPKQGYHVKLTYTATDGNTQGNTVKHKVFWVQPCTRSIVGTPGVTTFGIPTSGHGPERQVILGIRGAVSGMSFRASPAAALGATSTAHHARAVRGQPAFTG